MPTNRTRRARKREVFTLDDSMLNFLLTGAEPEEHDAPAWKLWRGLIFDDVQDKLKHLWRKHRAELLTSWKASRRQCIPWIQSEVEGSYYAD